MVNDAGYNKKNKKGIAYPNPLSAIRPVPHVPDLLVPSPPDNLSGESESGSLQSIPLAHSTKLSESYET
jgi:hypothetical protein